MKLKGNAEQEIVLKDELDILDIILVHTKRSFFPWLIRFGTRSYWNHVAAVFLIRNKDKGFNNSFIIESATGGVDIHNILDEYFLEPRKYDIGIKRIRAGWLKNRKDGLRIRKLVRGHLLDLIDADYDYGLLLRITRNILDNILFFQRMFFDGIRRYGVAPLKHHKHVPSRYICSGYVQYTLYQTIKSLLKRKKSGIKKVNITDILFNRLFREKEEVNLLLSTTPEDFSSSDRLEWRYIVRNGTVHRINKDEEVKMILYENN
ncbi:MAG: hypothetical protein PHF84_01755 [bacterium]|nr:hypothetical protein [bacterium]